jgi:hypothetical protein
MSLSGVSSDSWWAAILSGIKAPDNATTRSNLNAWQACEGADATFNPFNTTLWWPRSSCYNSVCVRNYANFQDGVSATVSTILQSNMSPILAALRGSYNRDGFANAIDASPWGTSGACVRSAPGGPTGGAPGPPGPIKGTSTPPPPKETPANDWSGHIFRVAAQVGNTGRTAMAHAKLIRDLRIH